MEDFNPTHKGLVFGIVPVYLDMTIEDYPKVEGRFLGCNLLLDIFESLFDLFILVVTSIDPLYEVSYPLTITEELEQK